MEHMASHSLTRLYIVVSKSVTEETLEYMFGVFEGLEYVDLKRDHASGLSRVIISSKAVLGSPPQPIRLLSTYGTLFCAAPYTECCPLPGRHCMAQVHCTLMVPGIAEAIQHVSRDFIGKTQ